MSNLKHSMVQYFKNRNNKNFERLLKELEILEFASDYVEKICSQNIPEIHKGLLMLNVGRLLEACYFLEKHLTEKNSQDISANVWLQYASVKRGDLNKSYDVIQRLDKIGQKNVLYRAIVIHALAQGKSISVISYCYELINQVKNPDSLTIEAMYDTAWDTKDFRLIHWLIGNRKTLDMIENSSLDYKRFKTAIVNCLVNQLSKIIKEKQYE